MRALALIAISSAGCNAILGIGDVHSTSGIDAPAATIDAPMGDCPPPPSDGIIACANITHITLTGSTSVSRKDLSQFTAAAYVKDSSASGFKIVQGTTSADGTVIVHGIDPGASYYLRLQNSTDPIYPWPHYFYTSQRTLDLGYTEVGRDDTPATLQTDVTFHLSGLTAWGPNQTLYAESFNAGTNEGMDFVTKPAPGATAFDTKSNWADGTGEATWADNISEAARKGQLLDSSAAHGDDLWVHHDKIVKVDIGLASQAPGFYQVTTHVDSAMVDPGTMVNGSATSITAALTPAPAAAAPQHITVNYDAARAAFRDNGVYNNESFFCGRFANPGADLGLQQDMLIGFNAPQIYGWEHSADLSQPYRNPFPTTIPQTMDCNLTHTAFYKAPNKGVSGFSYIAAIVPATNNFTFNPPIHGPTNVLIGGQPAGPGGTVPFDGVAPLTMSWDPQPGITHYHVRAIGSVEGVVGEFDTADTSIVIPADTFTKGNFYYFRVFVIQSPDHYADGQLLRFTSPVWIVRLATGLFRLSNLCGNNVKDAGEDCDPGAPNTSTAACDADCTTATCNDGFVNAAAGEQCDQRFDGSTCNGNCKLPMCGDGYFNPMTEQCDDGNTVNGDGCNSLCKLEQCGDGVVQGTFETCDDGNRVSGDGCSSLCQLECGDSFVDAPGEECDPPDSVTCNDMCKKI